MMMSEPTLIERLQHFEDHSKEMGDGYGAEVLCHARERIAQLEAENETLKREIIKAKTNLFEYQHEYMKLKRENEKEHEQVCQFIRDMYTGRFAKREEYYWELPQWIRDAIEADPIYNTAQEQE